MRRFVFMTAPLTVVWFMACTADVRLGDLAEPQGTPQDGATESSSDAALTSDGALTADALASDGASDASSNADSAVVDAACVVDCKGNPCSNNVCQPLTLVMAEKQPVYLALDATSVYYTQIGHTGTLADPNPVKKMAKAGGAATVLAQDDGFPRGIAVDATNVYWNDAAEGGQENVWRASNVDGSGATIMGRMPVPADIQGLALSQTLAYAASGNEVRYFGKTANMSFGLEATNKMVHLIGVAATTDDTFVYAADLGAASLAVMDLTGMTSSAVAVGNGPVDVAMDADYTFLATGAEIVRVSRVDNSTTVLATGLTGCSGVSVDTDTVYFVTKTEIRKVLKVGGASTLLASGLSQGGRIATDDTYAFYTDVQAGLIGRVLK
jgi:hypothetical protein